jgi:NTP pyrophosphatase (non-canonical NTP hydrolase)
MKYEEYLKGVNSTWKKDDGLVEVAHCKIAIKEEIGELFGWYKQIYGYKKKRTKPWRNNVLGEIGDLLYYNTKLSDLANISLEVEDVFLPTYTTILDFTTELQLLDEMMATALVISTEDVSSSKFEDASYNLFELVHQLILVLGFDLEEVQLANLAKLEKRHGKGFNQKATSEECRDRDAEEEAIEGAG